MNRDPELPGGFQDADFEARGLEAAGARISRARKAGRCAHGWTGPAADRPGLRVCLYCGKIGTEAELMAEYKSIVGGE
jgi:hypothetical protein